eukprot:scaffold11979_cov130-Cylindrotheca_fusiformis.AAC.1
MLEETLSSPTYSPAEAALTLISFVEVELAAGGPSAEARFFKLFSMLCDRVFGFISEKDYRHETGGWLSRHVRWERPQQRSSGTHPNHPGRPSSTSISTDPVVKLLGARMAKKPDSNQATALTLIEAMAKEAEHRPNVRYPFPFEALPKSTQIAWLSLIESALKRSQQGGFGGPNANTPQSFIPMTSPQSMVIDTVFPNTPPTPSNQDSNRPVSENSRRLMGSVFRVKPLEQNQLRLYLQNKLQKKDLRRPLQLSPMYNRPRSPSLTISSTTPGSSGNSAQNDKGVPKPKIMLSMLEYYLVLFLRYPLAAPEAQAQTKPTSVSRNVPMPPVGRSSEPYGDSVYYYLFQEYVNYYVIARSPQGHSNTGFATIGRPTELFVRIVVELWLEGQNQMPTTETAIKVHKERRGIMDPHALFDLNKSYDLVKLKYESPPHQIQRCFHKLLARAVSDGATLDVVRDTHAGLRGATPEVMCLSPVMSILQLPFYNHVRTAFRYASIHATQSPFYSALNDWLVWLEPWNTKFASDRKDASQRLLQSLPGKTKSKTSSSPKVTYPKPKHRSAYKPEWEPYIASNLHLYTVPLAIFLRRARELDFSPKHYDRSLATVLRVFRVFTPEVVGVINKLLEARRGGSQFSGIVARHEQNLGVYAPPENQLSLSSCQDDMHNLLEEICLQHLKKVDSLDIFDRAIAKLESYFGGGAYAGDEKELAKLADKAKVIVGFPAGYEVMPALKAGSFESSATDFVDSSVDRTTSGMLTDAGRQRLIAGSVKCNPEDVDYFGDKMLGRPQSHEIRWLVPLLVSVSKFLNAKLGIQPPEDAYSYSNSLLPKRFNLRFLADYRNIIFICFLSWSQGTKIATTVAESECLQIEFTLKPKNASITDALAPLHHLVDVKHRQDPFVLLLFLNSR